jgi:hypothetical protein
MRTGKRGRGLRKSARIVECKKHGLAYDVTSSTGCVLCIRERKQFAAGSSAGSKALIIGLALVAAAAIVYVLVFDRGADEEPIASASRVAGPSDKSPEEAAKEKEKKAAAAIGNLVDELSRLIENAQTDMANFGETRVDLRNVDEGENQQRLSDWRFWVESWLDGVDGVRGENLNKKVYIPQKQSAALRSAQFAIRRMKQVPNAGPGVPLKPGDEGFRDYYMPDDRTRKAWLDEIRRLIDQAHRQLEPAI